MKKEGRKKLKDEDLKPVEKEDVVNGKEVLSDSEDDGVESPVVSDDDYGSFSEGDDSLRNSDSESESGSEQSEFSEDELPHSGNPCPRRGGPIKYMCFY
ncbi:uncharacterized protein LOC128128152 isoform X2 [Lactuca sativa]|uniref:uncharacterized protein LOC128128152 isoform X2 n=1 Tax=Lactuca sativa TaxID=4236 RepID=UPI0022AF03BC|nr:uncharacterized protein LOC128128152 isoform X2 [Lactuca sativa]